jgi:hypothetical protein
VLDVVPLEVREVTRVSLPCGGHARRVTSAQAPTEGHFLDGLEVDRETSNMMATTFLGAVLVALGAVLFSMFGGKGKSA